MNQCPHYITEAERNQKGPGLSEPCLQEFGLMLHACVVWLIVASLRKPFGSLHDAHSHDFSFVLRVEPPDANDPLGGRQRDVVDRYVVELIVDSDVQHIDEAVPQSACVAPLPMPSLKQKMR